MSLSYLFLSDKQFKTQTDLDLDHNCSLLIFDRLIDQTTNRCSHELIICLNLISQCKAREKQRSHSVVVSIWDLKKKLSVFSLPCKDLWLRLRNKGEEGD